jgi:hypothetical protein
MRQKQVYLTNLLENKILITVEHLNSLGFFPNSLGVYKILKGEVDEETKPFINCPTFRVIISIPKKKISLRINMLIRHDFLKNKYSINDDMMVLEISEKGKRFLTEYYKNHKIDFTKKRQKSQKTIIKL